MDRILCLLVLTAGVLAAQEPGPRARAAVQELGQKIRSLLASELASGGFEGAVGVCAEKAQAETKRYAAEQGIQIRRVSTRARNEANRPDEWERTRLLEWETALREGKTAPESAQTTTSGGDYRLLMPIRVQAMCLTCHGNEKQIPARVRDLLHKHYPEDAATGYRNGDLRGAFSVVIPRDR
ncbi:MAG: DUF3365 domain-containing protein [Bryobacteraceae bacterium]|nr:DUF3365 domain-containing protein [Solibacteraceae bacterium]MCL4842389.1 DUF3365 domain-containing protein [Bryobacteraceae bacterium]MCO5351967.1 DUF3365 domain-containing protein [Bryobacteraceae bacterium]